MQVYIYILQDASIYIYYKMSNEWLQLFSFYNRIKKKPREIFKTLANEKFYG